MIRAFFGLDQNPFACENVTLLKQQQEVYDTLKVHCRQGGLCLVMGEPGTGKTVIKEAMKQFADKRLVVVTIGRTLHTYTNTIKILCQAFQIEEQGEHFKCEKRLIEQAFNLNREGKMLVTVIDDAHLMEIPTLRKLRLMFEDFPKNHNLILIGQTCLLSALSLRVNEDLKSRITFSTCMPRLGPEDTEAFILKELDKVQLGHNTFTSEALALIVRSSDGFLRRVRNLSISCLLEAVRDRKKSIDLDIVNRVLIQPHWRNDYDMQNQ